jgi:dTMP kinase
MFVTFEGVEGSSKTTQAKLLSEWLEIDHILTKEPGTHMVESCRKIRELILNPNNDISRRTEFFLYLADRAEHVEKCIEPALRNGKWVISDRYFDSTRVYQGIGRGLGLEDISPMVAYATRGIMPDITFIMDVPAEIGLKRAMSSNKEFIGGDRMERESIDFHNSLREGFLEIAKTHERYIILDAKKSIPELHMEVQATLEPYILGGGNE